MINKAIEFATLCHANQARKGTEIPYILHCLEAGTIAANLTNKDGMVDDEVVAAAILHDTIEDAYVSYESLKEIFNENIADLVQNQSEDKSKSWQERKEATINFLLENKSKEVEISTLADKLSNMRSIYRDYKADGEELWKKFNAGKASQHWYYKSIASSLSQIRNSDEYREFVELIKQTFEQKID
ncbi:MAG: bifunctional (p)ppGpp synthetase/guanosine-3',5'-bis(diphosphate) 3'-pyrophosphohydrolase [Bacteroidales bacterium]|nr:bifunctional (p)ppGpp synthetase/guanosine-3',5'-bis(diphosphate) 3'-pyrophosphohydrolase [Bacteroidales bacterium]